MAGGYSHIGADGEMIKRRVDTRPGRMLLAEILPKHPAMSIEIVNRLLNKKDVAEVIDTVYRTCGQKETVIFCDSIMALGFQEACKAGISFGKDDMVIPRAKEIGRAHV